MKWVKAFVFQELQTVALDISHKTVSSNTFRAERKDVVIARYGGVALNVFLLF